MRRRPAPTPRGPADRPSAGVPVQWPGPLRAGALVAAAGLLLAGLAAGCSPSREEAPAAAPDTPADTVQIDIVGTTTLSGTPGTDGAADLAAVSTTPVVSHTLVARALVPEVVARSEPDDAAPVVAELANPIASGTELVFRVLDGGAQNPDWVHVQLPVEPNGTTGWIRSSEIAFGTSPYRIEIDRATFSLRVFNLDQLWLDTKIAVGTGDTPTPVGEFYLLELLAPERPDGPYGPYAFGLSGFSEVLDGFAGADTAIIGIHGTNDPAAIGTNVSHGCIRVSNEVIEQLAATLPLGTPVTIT
jgi:lipoprotein-anchoring transpeptidase ErfK/SrfK